MNKLMVSIKASEHEMILDDYYEDGEPFGYDDLYDYFIHEIITQPNYEWKVVDEFGEEVEIPE